MTNFLSINQEQKMSSREIAVLTGKRHDNILRDLRKFLIEKNINALNFEAVYFDEKNEKRVMYSLPFKLTMHFIAKIYPDFVEVITDQWIELNKPKTPNSFANALKLAYEQQLQIEQQAALLLEQQPQVAVYKILADRKQDVNTTELAKQIGTTANKLNIFLRANNIKFKDKELPKAKYQSWFNVVATVSGKNGYEATQCLITPLGQIEITKLWSVK